MKLQFSETDEIIFVDKPAGFSTHSPDEGHLGLCEIFSQELQKKLYVVHRLDKTTTGALCFAKSAKKAQELTELFQQRKIKKKYLFLTAARSRQDHFEIQSTITKSGKTFSSDPKATDPNAQTSFKRVKRNPLYELWEAHPKTGKSHQIRLHAADAGLPILGDTLYGGKPFPHLCLHAESIEIPGLEVWTCAAPPFFNRMGLLHDEELVCILAALDRRQRLFQFLRFPTQCLRVVDSEANSQLQVRADAFGQVLWVYWYREQPPEPKDFERWSFVSDFCGKKLVLRQMQNRGSDPLSKKDWKNPPDLEAWSAQEGSTVFEFRTSSGLSPGLFLDQRENRQYIARKASGMRVLNLFAYTCGFSVVAALGGASEVVSVDVSTNFLEWGKKNFHLNGLSPERYEFYGQDTQIFLKGAAKRQRKFDVIVVDPPSFSRAAKGHVFRLEKDFKDLLKLCVAVLADKGLLLISVNFEKWNETQLAHQIRKSEPNLVLQKGFHGWDFELPEEEPKMKSFFALAKESVRRRD